jgi:hypothetical protein
VPEGGGSKMAMKPICVPCQRFFRVVRNGFAFIEAMPIGPGHPLPGVHQPEGWQPYKLWQGDRYECEGCHAVIVVGVGWQPLAEHYQPDFAERVRAFNGDQLQVNDC